MDKNYQTIYFAAGCFWHVQHTFDKTKGVIETKAGYMGGNEENPATYENSEKEGYAETVKVVFDPKETSLEKLLDIFWKEHEPTSHDRQGADVGKRYRAVIFYSNKEQKKKAFASLDKIKEKYKGKEVYTTIEKARKFFVAEEYHQHYLDK